MEIDIYRISQINSERDNSGCLQLGNEIIKRLQYYEIPVSHIFSKHKQHNNNFLAESIMKFLCGSCIDIGT